VHFAHDVGRGHQPDYPVKAPNPPESDGKATNCNPFSAKVASHNLAFQYLLSHPLMLTVHDLARRPRQDTPKVWQGENLALSYSTSNAVFNLSPGENDGLYFIGRGSFSNGRIHFVQGDSDQVVVEVQGRYNDERLLDLVNVCQLEREGKDGGKEYGIGIYVCLCRRL
jgi:hypothetical protein